MASLDTLLDNVMPNAPRLTVELARQEIRKAAIRFCRKSRIDRRRLDAFPTVAGQAAYNLADPAGMALVEVLLVSLDNEIPLLDPLRPDEIPADAEAEQGRPKWFCSKQGGAVLQLIYAPDAVYSVAATVAVEPASDATTLDDWIAKRYGEEISYGALEVLLAIPKKPWTDTAMAAYYKGLFDAAIIDAASAADQGFTAAPTRTRPVFGLR
jgi:hypothetical protein